MRPARIVAAVMLTAAAAATGSYAAYSSSHRSASESPPAKAPGSRPCRLAQPAMYVCSYTLAEHAELTVIVEGGASAGYGMSGVEFGD